MYKIAWSILVHGKKPGVVFSVVDVVQTLAATDSSKYSQSRLEFRSLKLDPAHRSWGAEAKMSACLTHANTHPEGWGARLEP